MKVINVSTNEWVDGGLRVAPGSTVEIPSAIYAQATGKDAVEGVMLVMEGTTLVGPDQPMTDIWGGLPFAGMILTLFTLKLLYKAR